MSTMTIIMLLIYGGYKMVQLTTFDDYKTQIRVEEHYFNPDHKFSMSDQQFQVAAAITAYDGDPEPIEDPSYGTLVFKKKQWNYQDEPFVEFGFADLKSRPCTESDFNWGDGRESDKESLFYPIASFNKNDLKIYSGKMKCLDEDVDIFGNFDQQVASNLMVIFEKCN